MKKFILQLLLLAFFSLLLIVSFDFFYRRSFHRQYQWPEAFLLSPRIAEPYELVKVGNSHPQSGLDFSHYKIKSLDLTGAAQRFSFDLAMLKQHRQQIKPGAIILLAVTPLSFSHRPADQNDGLQGNYYRQMSPFLIPHIKWSNYFQTQITPFVRSGYLWRQEVKKTVEDRLSLEQRNPELDKVVPKASPLMVPTSENSKVVKILTVDSDNYFYNVEAIKQEIADHTPEDPRRLQDNMNFVYHKWNETDEFGQQYFAENRHDLEKLILYCQEQGWRPVLLTLPISQILLDGLQDDYMDVYLYQNLAKMDLHAVEYLDYSANTGMSDDILFFENADHLSKNGAKVFSYLLLQDLIQQGYLDASVDNYNYGPLYQTVLQK